MIYFDSKLYPIAKKILFLHPFTRIWYFLSHPTKWKDYSSPNHPVLFSPFSLPLKNINVDIASSIPLLYPCAMPLALPDSTLHVPSPVYILYTSFAELISRRGIPGRLRGFSTRAIPTVSSIHTPVLIGNGTNDTSAAECRGHGPLQRPAFKGTDERKRKRDDEGQIH